MLHRRCSRHKAEGQLSLRLEYYQLVLLSRLHIRSAFVGENGKYKPKSYLRAIGADDSDWCEYGHKEACGLQEMESR